MGSEEMYREEGRQGVLNLTLQAAIKWFKGNFSSLHRRQSPDNEMYGVVRLQFLDTYCHDESGHSRVLCTSSLNPPWQHSILLSPCCSVLFLPPSLE